MGNSKGIIAKRSSEPFGIPVTKSQSTDCKCPKCSNGCPCSSCASCNTKLSMSVAEVEVHHHHATEFSYEHFASSVDPKSCDCPKCIGSTTAVTALLVEIYRATYLLLIKIQKSIA